MQKNNQSITDILDRQAIVQAEKIAFAFESGFYKQKSTLTFYELRQAALNTAHHLQQLNSHNNVILLLFNPGINLIVSFYACLYAGKIPILMMPPYNKATVERLNHIIEDAQTNYVLSEKIIYQELTALNLLENLSNKTSALKSINQFSLNYLHWVLCEEIPDNLTSSFNSKTNDIAFLQYTSGSTSDPRGVMVTQANVMDNLQRITQGMQITADDRLFSWLPPYHDMGLIGSILEPVYAGFTTYFTTTLDFLRNPITNWLKQITQHQITLSGGPNFAYQLCVQRANKKLNLALDLSSWRVAYNGAEPICAKTLENFNATFAHYGFNKQAFFPCYGLAEATLYVCGADAKQQPVCITVAKKALQNHQVKILPETASNDSMRLVSSGLIHDDTVFIVNSRTHSLCVADTVGEICVTNDSVAQGYWRKTKISQQTFNYILPSMPNRPLLRTGDLGFIHENQLYVTGRIKDIIVINGSNHYPTDIEKTIYHACPDVRVGSVAAFGLDNEGVEQLCVLVEPRKSLDTTQLTTMAEVIEQAVLHEHEIAVTHLYFVQPKALPKTTSGKLQRRKAKQFLLDGTLDILFSCKAYNHPPHEKIPISSELLTFINLIAELLQISPDEINPEKPLSIYGIDSIKLLQLLNTIEDKYTVTLEIDFLRSDPPLNEIFNAVRHKNIVPDTIHCTSSACHADQIIHYPQPQCTNQQAILLTGSTGLLGSYLIKELLEKTNYVIFCLNRKIDQHQALELIKNNVTFFANEMLEKYNFKNRIYPLHGDITQTNLGIDCEYHKSLFSKISHVIHSAANIDLVAKYENLYATNVQGTQNVIDFVNQYLNKAYLIYVSSYSVMGDRLYQKTRPFCETDFNLQQNFDGMGYQKSKFMAEQLIRQQQSNWLIVRPGNIFGESHSGKYPLDGTHFTSLFYDIFKTIIQTGVACNTHFYFDITPVDYVARSIVALIKHTKQLSLNTFHLTNPHPPLYSNLIEMIKAHGYAIDLIPTETYVELLKNDKLCYKGKNYYSSTTELFKAHPHLLGNQASSYASSDLTREILNGFNVEFPPNTQQLISNYLGYCAQNNYF
ncbi:MAG: hypothetical protein Tsb005_15630 [Gammaproteobacteria bacterium]